jgi:hypothetical protein
METTAQYDEQRRGVVWTIRRAYWVLPKTGLVVRKASAIAEGRIGTEVRGAFSIDERPSNANIGWGLSPDAGDPYSPLVCWGERKSGVAASGCEPVLNFVCEAS